MEWIIVIGVIAQVAIAGAAYKVLPKMFKKYADELVHKATAEVAKEIRRLRYR